MMRSLSTAVSIGCLFVLVICLLLAHGFFDKMNRVSIEPVFHTMDRIELQDAVPDETSTNFPSGIVRDHLRVNPRSFQILHEAMLSETEDPEGTGKAANGTGLRVCG